MATYLAPTTTLAMMRQYVIGMLSSTNDLNDVWIRELDNIIYNSCVLVRTMLGRGLDDFYRTRNTNLTVTSGGTGIYTADLSTHNIANTTTCSVYASSVGYIPFKDPSVFNLLRSLYTTSDLSTSGIATLTNTYAVESSASTLQLVIYTGATLTTVEFVYTRGVKRAQAAVDTLDIPETLMPLVRDISAFVFAKKRSNSGYETSVTTPVNDALKQIIQTYGTPLNVES